MNNNENTKDQIEDHKKNNKNNTNESVHTDNATCEFSNESFQDSENSSENFSDINIQDNIDSLDDSFIIGRISLSDLIVKDEDVAKTAPASLEIHHVNKGQKLIDKIKSKFKDKVKKQEHLNNFKIDDKIKDTINNHLKDKLNGSPSNIVIESDSSNDSLEKSNSVSFETDILFEYDI